MRVCGARLNSAPPTEFPEALPATKCNPLHGSGNTAEVEGSCGCEIRYTPGGKKILPPPALFAWLLHTAVIAAWIAAVSSVVLSPFAPYAVTSTRGRGPVTVSFPSTLNVDGVSVPGLKLVEDKVPLTVAFPATVKFPPSVSPNAEILFPLPIEETSAGRITSG